jgi:hypothetical protein
MYTIVHFVRVKQILDARLSKWENLLSLSKLSAFNTYILFITYFFMANFRLAILYNSSQIRRPYFCPRKMIPFILFCRLRGYWINFGFKPCINSPNIQLGQCQHY